MTDTISISTSSEAAALDIRLFGPIEVRVQGQPLGPLRSPRAGQSLLALLVLRHDRETERSWLAGTLWPESLQGQSLYNLSRNLTALRHALDSQSARLLSPSSRSLRLDLTNAWVDVLAFDAAIERGDASSLEQAVTLYRGPLLEGCLEEWVLPEREAREQAYMQALETLAARAREGGEAITAAQYLRRVVGIDPLRESVQRSLMQALADAGDYAAAVLVYRDLRLRLHQELKAEPAPQTTALFQQLRASARCRAQAAVVTQPKTPAAPPPRRLPRPLSGLIGREREIEEIASSLAAMRLLTLTGPGGVGKTRLAIAVAEAVAEEYPDGVFFVDLAPLANPDLIAQAVASALEVREQPGTPLPEMLHNHLQTKALLLVLDNCEHLLSACASLVGDLLQHCGRLRILATSRQSLGIIGELVWSVPSLSVPDRRPASTEEKDAVSALMAYEGVQLFVARAGLVRPAFRLTSQNAAAVGQICRQLDGIPLALELAAARLKALSVEQVASRLEEGFSLLTGGSRTALPRQQTLKAALDWSYHLLTEPERTLLRRLYIFAGGWTLDAAEEVTGDRLQVTEKALTVPCPLSPRTKCWTFSPAWSISHWWCLSHGKATQVGVTACWRRSGSMLRSGWRRVGKRG